MNKVVKRATVYIEPEIHQAIKIKSAITHLSISDIVNDSLRATLREDEEDLAAFEERASEPNISYEEFLGKLKADGTI